MAGLSAEWSFWEEDEVLKTLNQANIHGYIAYDEPLLSYEQLNGFVFYSVMFDSADLLYVYIPKSKRGSGFGLDLLETSLERLSSEEQIQRVLLEVRISNNIAIDLYKKLGFHQIDTRKSYYKDGETALIFSKEF